MAPLQPSTLSLPIVFNATDGSRWGQTRSERLTMLAQNMNTLMGELNVGAMTQGGMVDVELHKSYSDVRRATARLVASTEAEYAPGADHATLTVVLTNPTGKWTGATRTASLRLDGTQMVTAAAGCTAQIDRCYVTLVGPMTSATITNSMGNGFHLSTAIPAGRQITVDCRRWLVSSLRDYTGVPVFASTSRMSPDLQLVGSTSSLALTMHPRPAGATLNVATTGTSVGSQLHIQFQEAYL